MDIKEKLDRNEYLLKDNPKGKASCWEVFKLVYKDEQTPLEGWAACKHCYTCLQIKVMKESGKWENIGTKNLNDHLKLCKPQKRKQLPMISFLKRQPGLKLADSDRKRIKRAEARFVVQTGSSFNCLDNEGFKSFAKEMVSIGAKYGNVNIEDVLYGRKTIRTEVLKMVDEVQAFVKEEVSKCVNDKAVSYVTDICTDNVNKRSYMDFTLFWVSELDSWYLKHAQYKCLHFPERHTAENIGHEIDKCLEELRCDKQDTPVTTDCGANIVAATNSRTRIDCCAHRLNTAIQAGWKAVMLKSAEFKQLNEDCHQLVTYVNQASGIQDELPATLKHGGTTRPWRSLQAMFTSILISAEALKEILSERKRHQLIQRVDIDLLKMTNAFLMPLSGVFDMLEYADSPTLQNVLPSYYLLRNFWQPQLNDCENVTLLKAEFTKALDAKVWPSIKVLHMVAVYLDPTLRSFSMCMDLADRASFIEQAEEALVLLGIEMIGTLTKSDDKPNRETEVAQKPQTTEPTQSHSDIFAEYRTASSSCLPAAETESYDTLSDSQIKDVIKKEITEYKSKCSNDNNVPLLKWWHLQKAHLPILSCVARSVYVISASSSESERHFSAFNANKIIHPQRSILSPDAVQAISLATEYYKNF